MIARSLVVRDRKFEDEIENCCCEFLALFGESHTTG